MKKLTLLAVIAFSFMFETSTVQAQVIGKINHDGIAAISIKLDEAKAVLEKASLHTEPQPFQATEITLTNLPQGQVCLTGYIRNPVGIVISGYRIVCLQDDDNNLIVVRGSYSERVQGHPF